MNAKQKILYILNLIETANALAADSQPCTLDPDTVDENKVTYIELKAIMNKLNAENAIKILEEPNTRTVVMASANNIFYYTIVVQPLFDDYYDKFYTADQFDIKNLTHDNYYRVLAVAEQINQELNIRTDNVATFEANKAAPKALGFLKEVGAINTYDLYKPRGGLHRPYTMKLQLT